jgi:hypothetical protein
MTAQSPIAQFKLRGKLKCKPPDLPEKLMLNPANHQPRLMIGRHLCGLCGLWSGATPKLKSGAVGAWVMGAHYPQSIYRQSLISLNLSDIATAAFDWYAKHNLNQQVKIFAQVLSQSQFSFV